MLAITFEDRARIIFSRAVNAPALANIDPQMRTTTSAEREQLLKTRQSFHFSPKEVLPALYMEAGLTP